MKGTRTAPVVVALAVVALASAASLGLAGCGAGAASRHVYWVTIGGGQGGRWAGVPGRGAFNPLPPAARPPRSRWRWTVRTSTGSTQAALIAPPPPTGR